MGTLKIGAALLLSLCSSWAMATAIQVGQVLPQVSIQEGGELVLSGADVTYQHWKSDQLSGKVYVVQHIAGRGSAKEMNAPLIERIKAAKLQPDQYQTVTLVNTDDAIWGTSGIVKGKLEGSKKEFPWSMMVLDKEGAALNQWQLEKQSSAIIVLDKNRQVRWMKEGVLNEDEQNQVMQLVTQLLK